MSESTAQACAARYRTAYDQALLAWTRSQLLSRCRRGPVVRARKAMAQGSAGELAALVVDAGGPMHPGRPERAAEGFTREAQQLAAAVIEALAQPLIEARQAQGGEQSASVDKTVDMQGLCDSVCAWIEHGRPTGQSSGDSEAARIALWLKLQAPGRDPTAMRLAVVAMTAPAIASLGFIGRLPSGVVDSLTQEPSVTAENWAAQQAASPMWRDAVDDADHESTAERVAQGANRAAGRS